MLLHKYFTIDTNELGYTKLYVVAGDTLEDIVLLLGDTAQGVRSSQTEE